MCFMFVDFVLFNERKNISRQIQKSGLLFIDSRMSLAVEIAKRLLKGHVTVGIPRDHS